MRSEANPIEFFREATLHICGSLEIEKALGGLFDYIQNFIPLDEIYLHHFIPDSSHTHVFAMADKKGSRSMDIKIKWSAEVVDWMQRDSFPLNILANKADEHPVLKYALKPMNKSNVSMIVVRLSVEGEWVGAVTLLANEWDRFTQEHLNLISALKRPFTIALSNNRQYRELLDLKDLLADDKRYLQQQLQMTISHEVIGADSGLRKVMEMVRQVSSLDSPVLLQGETGTGKEVIANTIHLISNRSDGPFIKVNCGAIPDSLMDSELFGHEKGAFTGALKRSRGRFERADGGTIFLDEIGELSSNAQVRLLRVLQDKTIERVGGSKTISLNIRVIAATHRNLENMIKENKFREDLFFRLQIFPIVIPPLRQRKMDIPALVQHFLLKKTTELGFTEVPELAPGSQDFLKQYSWPGNVRELENLIERALILNPTGPIDFYYLPFSPDNNATNDKNETGPDILLLDEVISKHIKAVLKMANGKVNGEKGAAKLLGMNASTLRHKMRKMGIPFGRNINKKQL